MCACAHILTTIFKKCGVRKLKHTPTVDLTHTVPILPCHSTRAQTTSEARPHSHCHAHLVPLADQHIHKLVHMFALHNGKEYVSYSLTHSYLVYLSNHVRCMSEYSTQLVPLIQVIDYKRTLMEEREQTKLKKELPTHDIAFFPTTTTSTKAMHQLNQATNHV